MGPPCAPFPAPNRSPLGMSTNIDDLAWLVHYARILSCFNYEISQNFRKGQSRNASYLARISTCKHLVTLVLDLSFVRKRSEPHTYSPLLGRATLVAIRFLSQAYGSSGCLPAPPSRQSFWVGPRRSRWPLGSPSINTSPHQPWAPFHLFYQRNLRGQTPMLP